MDYVHVNSNLLRAPNMNIKYQKKILGHFRNKDLREYKKKEIISKLKIK